MAQVADWLHRLRDLDSLLSRQHQLGADAEAVVDAAEALVAKIASLGSQPPMKKEAWRRLVQQEQVLLKICRALTGKPSSSQAPQTQQQHLQQQQQPTFPATEQLQSGHHAAAASTLMIVFLNKAFDELPLPQDASTNPFKQALVAQLHASGLLLHLPALLDAAADAMAARVQQRRAEVTPEAPSNSNSGSSSSSSSSSSGGSTSASSCSSAQEEQDKALSTRVMQLLYTHFRLHSLLPPDASFVPTYAHSAPALARAVHTAMQYVSVLMMPPSRGQQATSLSVQHVRNLLDILKHATTAMITAADAQAMVMEASPAALSSDGTGCNYGLASTPGAAALYLSPHYVPSLVLATAVTAYSLLAASGRYGTVPAAAAHGGSSSSNTAGSSRTAGATGSGAGSSAAGASSDQPSSNTAASSRTAGVAGNGSNGSSAAGATSDHHDHSRSDWETCQHCQRVLPRFDRLWQQAQGMQAELSSCQQQLFELLGVDSRVVMWAAASCGDGPDPKIYTRDFSVLVTTFVDVARFWHMHATPQHIQQYQQHQQLKRLHMLLPSLLLHYPAQLPNGGTFLRACVNTAYTSKGAIQLWELLGPQPRQQQQDDEQEEQGQLGNSPGGRFPAAELVTELLPAVLGVSARLKKLLSATEQASPQAAQLAAADPQGDVNPSMCRSAYADMTRVLLMLVDLSHQHALVAPVAAAAAEAAAVDGPVALDLFLPVLQGRLREVLRALECFVRSAAATELAAHDQPDTSLSNSTECAVLDITALFTPGNQPLARLALSTAPGSPERKHLHSLLVSLQKLAANLWGRVEREGPTVARPLAVQCLRALVAFCPAPLVTLSRRVPVEPAAPGPAAGPGADGGPPQPEATLTFLRAAAEQMQLDAGEWTAEEVAAVLPSMLLVGRCCLLYAQYMQLGAPAGLRSQSCCIMPRMCNVDPLQSSLEYLLRPCQVWLATPSVAEQLAALGYNPQRLQQAVTEALAAWDAVTQVFPMVLVTFALPAQLLQHDSFVALARKLQVVGAALASVAVPGLCNNPGCTLTDGPSELRSVSGQGGKCGGCKTAYFCSPQCLKQAWPQHRPVCRALAAAGKSAGATVQQEGASTGGT